MDIIKIDALVKSPKSPPPASGGEIREEIITALPPGEGKIYSTAGSIFKIEPAFRLRA